MEYLISVDPLLKNETNEYSMRRNPQKIKDKTQFGTFRGTPLFYDVQKYPFTFAGQQEYFYRIVLNVTIPTTGRKYTSKLIGRIELLVKPFSEAMDGPWETRCFDLMMILMGQYPQLHNQPVVSVR